MKKKKEDKKEKNSDKKNNEVKEENKLEMQAGFAACYAEPSDSLPINKQMACMQCYYNIAIEQSYFPVWDGTKSAEDAQAEIVKNAKNWFDTNNR